VILDVGGADLDLRREILPYLFIVSPNETELARVTGMEVETEEKVEEAARKLLSLGVKQVLVKLGSKGSLLVTGEVSIGVGIGES